MKISLNCGHASTTLDIPDKNSMGTLNPKKINEVANPNIEVKSDLANPIGSRKKKTMHASMEKVEEDT